MADCDSENPAGESAIRRRVDANGVKWVKVYTGGGEHFLNWLGQVKELKGEENVEVEEMESAGFACFNEAGEKMYRIWVRET